MPSRIEATSIMCSNIGCYRLPIAFDKAHSDLPQDLVARMNCGPHLAFSTQQGMPYVTFLAATALTGNSAHGPGLPLEIWSRIGDVLAPGRDRNRELIGVSTRSPMTSGFISL